MNITKRCESAAMDAAACFDDPDLPPIQPCDEVAVHEHSGYLLCAGCHDALARLIVLGVRLRRPPEAAA